MHRDDRHHVPAAALRGLERGDVAGASAFLAQGGEVDARGRDSTRPPVVAPEATSC